MPKILIVVPLIKKNGICLTVEKNQKNGGGVLCINRKSHQPTEGIVNGTLKSECRAEVCVCRELEK